MFSVRLSFLASALLLLLPGLCEAAHVSEYDYVRVGIVRSGAVLQNDKMALHFPRSEAGFTRYEVKLSATPERLMGVATPFSRLIYLSNKGQEHRFDVAPTTCVEVTPVEGNAKGLKFAQQFGDEDGVTWSFEATFMLSPDSSRCDVRYSISANEPRRIVQFRGPTLFAGESSFGTAMDEALFPGLEYLLGGERSSSRLAVTSKERRRFAPHPYKITVPLMGVLHDRGLVGLLWDANQKWDGRWECPQPLFSSPNWLEGKSNHLMMLSVPGFPWHEEYAAKAATPYPLKEGSVISVECKILAKQARNVTEAVCEWLNAYGYPKLPQKARSWEETVDLSLKPYLSSLWRESGESFGWIPWTGGTPMVNGDTCAALSLGAEITKDEELAKDIRVRVDHARKKVGLDKSSVSLAYGYRFGCADQAVANAGAEVDDLIAVQKPDGSWVFEPQAGKTIMGVSVATLGERGDTVVGLTAAPATKLLKFALATGDAAATQAGLKALEFMNRFVRPQGSQPWECPLAAPDILAAAHAADAYLHGYLLTGDPTHLERAKYWARTGLPFIYMWNAGDRSAMRYATVPVFGASMFTWPWFGKPVQWNGLAYADVIRNLARYDKTFDWLTVAKGITLCTIEQQAVDGEFMGLYPDAWDLIVDIPGRPWIHPAQFLLPPVYAMLGKNADPGTLILRGRVGRLHITAQGNIEANLNEDARAVWVRMTDAGGRSATISVAGLGKPSAVTCGDAKLTPAATLSTGGWVYRGGIVFATAPKTGTASFRITYDKMAFYLPPKETESPLSAYFLAFSSTAGQAAECKLRLRNRSKVPITDIEAAFEPPKGWIVRGPTGAKVKRIEPGTATDVTFVVTPPYPHSGERHWLGAGVRYKASQALLSMRAGASTKVGMPLGIRHYLEDTRRLQVTKVVELTNPGPDTLKGTVELSAPSGWKTIPPLAGFEIAPKEKQALKFVTTAPDATLPARYPGHLHIAIGQEHLPDIDVELEIAIGCEKVKSPIRIDGRLKDWENAPQITITRRIEDGEKIKGPEDLSAQVRVAWDEKFMYLAVEVTDDKFLQTLYGPDISRQDSVQVAFDTLRDANTGGYEDDDHEFGFALTPTDVLAWRFYGPPEKEPGRVGSIEVAIVRQEGKTVYEIGIPWSELAPFNPAVGKSLAMSILVNDDDGMGLKRLEWGGGIAKQKQPSRFIGVRLR